MKGAGPGRSPSRQLRNGFVSHPTFGWVPADWVPHLDRGELPAPLARGQKTARWLSAAEANGLRANWSPPWYINTEHFEIQTNVTHGRGDHLRPPARGVSRPVHGPVRRHSRRKPTARAAIQRPVDDRGDRLTNPTRSIILAPKSEYVDYLSPSQGPEIAKTLGFYRPPKSGGSRRMTAYFFRDPGGQLPVTATLYHEVSHQLLFETAGPNAYTRNVGNYWVFEGLGTYFETVCATTGRLARGRRPRRPAHRGGHQGPGGSEDSLSRWPSSSRSIKMPSTEIPRFISITSRPWH